MSESGAQKKKGSKKVKVQRAQDAPIQPKLISSSTTFFLSVPALIAILLYFYFNPTPAIEFFDAWIGFSDHYDSAPVPHTHSFTYLSADTTKRRAVLESFKHAWLAYERDAMGADEYHPISKQGSNLTDAGGIGFMVVDVLDSLQIMGLRAEYGRARKWVAERLDFDKGALFSTFETTIRVLGGLLSAYHLSEEDPIYLEKAIDLADRIMPVFETASGLPFPAVNLAERRGYHSIDFPGLSSVAEAGTLQLEFRYLSYLTENEVYWRAAENVMKVLKDARLPHGLASVFLAIEQGQYHLSAISLGSRADSFYEYLLGPRSIGSSTSKLSNQTERFYQDMYDDAMESIHNHLVQRSTTNNLLYTSELIPENGPDGGLTWRLTPKQDHLVCFLGGSLMLGATRTGALTSPVSIPPHPEELTEKGTRDWKTGVELIKTCMNMHDTQTGLSPEIVYFRVPSDGMNAMPNAPPDWYIRGAQLAPGELPPYDSRYMLRPETVESLFIAYRLTGDNIYREHGWKIFQAIEKHARVSTGGYATVINVDDNPASLEDKMETFFLSETLKYLYLLFDSSNNIPLDKYVLNTEAHPLPIFEPSIRSRFS
ncbi:glycoside hydrolase family 47 protein [Crepidotus variabilis]|uniref:alpha-1,2-Mannosidase n=1 Tax=Crepidotus variabilis TaxID=179855 RepID=A0A9P6EVE4_9AGAR|nr:glycoside hydrolase family 47 protein [Crepidotus variabilis]